MQITVETKFGIGDLVTFKGMVDRPRKAGAPQTLCVAFCRADWNEQGHVDVRYYCRLFCSDCWRREEQGFEPGRLLANGLCLVEESELVPLPVESNVDQPAPAEQEEQGGNQHEAGDVHDR